MFAVRRMKVGSFVIFLGVMLLAVRAQAYTVTGWVKKASDSTALSGVSVKAYTWATTTVQALATTNASGYFSLVGVSGKVSFNFVKSGYQTKNTAMVDVTSDGDIGTQYMQEEWDDPPTDPDDYDDEDQALTIYFEQSSTYYMGLQAKGLCKIYSNNSNFQRAHACSDYDKAADGQPTPESYRVDHLHHRYNYGAAGPGSPSWTTPPTWPTSGDAEDFWDWAYEDTSGVSGGGSATMVTNCASYAFDGLNGNDIRVAYWVDTSDTPGNCSNVKKLWDELTEVSPYGSGYKDDDIEDGDIAGNNWHVWVLKEPAASGPAKKIMWKNGGSGIYTWSHTGDPHNCGLDAGLDNASTVQANKLYTQSADNSIYEEARIKRDP
jgi:hypothetical protein